MAYRSAVGISGKSSWRVGAAVVSAVLVLSGVVSAPSSSAEAANRAVQLAPIGAGVAPVVSGDLTYFVGPYDLAASGYALLVTDGTAGGTRELVSTGIVATNDAITVVDGALYFVVNNDTSSPFRGDFALWTSDGTPAGTHAVADITTSAAGGSGLSESAPGLLTAVGDALYFVADDGVHGQELWTSDGTPAGTRMVVDLTPGGDGSVLQSLVDIDGTLAFKKVTFFPYRPSLWTSDGTAQGTEQVVSLPDFLYVVSDVPPVVMGGSVYFRQGESSGPYGLDCACSRLVASDLTQSGTRVLFDSGGPELSNQAVAGERLYFATRSATGNAELWVTDGTSGGTRMVYASASSGAYGELTAVGDDLYFVAYGADGPESGELWTSDGTASGTRRVADIDPGGSGEVRDLTAAGDALYFVADDGVRGMQVWTTDGTEAGTVRVTDLVQPLFDTGDSPATLVSAGEELYFSAQDAVGDDYLWRFGAVAPATGTRITAGPGDGDVVDSSSRDVTFAFGADGGAAGFECALDAAAYAPCSSPSTFRGLYNGGHSFAVRAVDGAGVADPHPATVDFKVAWNFFGVASTFRRLTAKGAIKARVYVPGPGRLGVTGDSRLVKHIGSSVDADGRTSVLVQPTKLGLRKLERARQSRKVGTLDVTATFFYRPVDGTRNTLKRDFVLKLK